MSAFLKLWVQTRVKQFQEIAKPFQRRIFITNELNSYLLVPNFNIHAEIL